jgi:predicted nucleic acid-binding protein
VVCCDTSFLFSLYGWDAHTDRALALVTKLSAPLTLTPLNDYELRNAVRFSVFRKVLEATAGAEILAAFDSDLATGRLILNQTNLTSVVNEAKRLSAAYTTVAGHRSFDILHVAAATHLSARLFLSFDANQRSLAQAAGLKTMP